MSKELTSPHDGSITMSIENLRYALQGVRPGTIVTISRPFLDGGPPDEGEETEDYWSPWRVHFGFDRPTSDKYHWTSRIMELEERNGDRIDRVVSSWATGEEEIILIP